MGGGVGEVAFRRLAMAQCFLRDGPVWILDEPMQGLDPCTERRLLMSIFERTEGKTVLMITHRFVELHHMDAIIVLKEGRIAAQGKYDDLIASNAMKSLPYFSANKNSLTLY
jgi:ATP-binding cassette subfamily C protein CydC